MELNAFVDAIKEYAQSVGFVPEKNGIWRKDINRPSNEFENVAYCGFIREGQEPSGPYSDFSLCFMPEKTNDDTNSISACAIVLVVGTQQFMYDGAIAQSPFTRRRFLRLNSNSRVYYKSDFSNITDRLPELTTKLKEEHPRIRQFDERFGPLVVAFEVVDIKNDFTVEDIPYEFKKWICAYAEFRGWPTNDTQRKEVVDVLDKLESINSKKSLTEDEIYKILLRDKYIILQGAPGTGKTYTALNIAEKFKNVKFTQFHAETSYSDFVYGIKPDTASNTLIYKDNPGVLYEAIKEANTGKDVLLIIDEINRANLSNVLGPVFYLFEKNTGNNRKYKIKIGDLEIDKLPETLYVIGTMNTADKSLAVVDFALRRRFTWITLRPQVIDHKDFRKEEFLEFENMFMRHATDEELNLQPGQSYFIAADDEAMKQRLKYELMPLIKEYINEGFLPSAKDEFVNYFYNKIGELMYE
ncbi:AAA domain (dynein-related subfamily) [Xylanibacter ruminicola]|uniref:AAA domain (Dynein-related subfamily) n=1 Tax=Xylanibacter ruminicola TaxID=839 RepID=A0A1H5VP84_XYLRU|nr:AAA family ATPase [Xylanibacter ruminicola]SEF89122.1 AAA domain (dynein-related subfamily) [Xylanibacter ruminicola]